MIELVCMLAVWDFSCVEVSVEKALIEYPSVWLAGDSLSSHC